jgi:hypothetical protein
MSDYKLFVAFEAFEFLERQPKRDKELLRNRFVAIRDWPARFSDFKEADSTGRNIDVHLCGRFAIRYWEDFADRHLKILDVTLADR